MPQNAPSRMTTSEFVADTLRREILRGDLSPGQALLQDHIAARFDVSQSSVREALRRLEALGLATSIRNRGTFVSKLTIAQVEEMYDVRLAIECLALHKNFNDISTDALKEAERLLNEVDKDTEISFLGEANKKFHAVFFDVSGETLICDILQNIYGNLTRLWVDFIKHKPSLARSYEDRSRSEHRELLQAAKNGDVKKAEEALTKHIIGARELLTAHLRDHEKSEDSLAS